MSDFEKLFAFKKSRFGSFYSVKTTFFTFFVLLFKTMVLNWKFCYVSDFELKKIQRFRFLNKIFTTRQILI